MNNNDIQLLEILKDNIRSCLNLIKQRELILSKNEGEISLILPSILSENPSYHVKINSYLMHSSGFPQEWSGKTLKIALQNANNDVKLWYQLEEESVSLSPLSKTLVQEYL